MTAQEILIVILILAVFLIAIFSIVKGRGFKFKTLWGGNEIEMDIAGKKEDLPEPTKGSGDIKDVSILGNDGKVSESNLNIHVGHNIEKKE